MNPVAATGARTRLVAAMAVGATLCTTGCVEIVKGPRAVTYTDTSFYIRSIPMFNGADAVGEIASAMCSENGRQAVLTDSYQDVPFGLRYSTFACL